MAKRRKTKAERTQESHEADQRVWDDFYPKLKAARSVKDVFMLYGATVPPDAPGRRFYSNLGFFLQAFAAPAGANTAELSEYLRLIAVFDAEGVLQPGALPEIGRKLQEAIALRLNR